MSDVDRIVSIHPSVLKGTRPAPDAYDSVSDGWNEEEYRADFGNPSVEGGYWTGLPGSVGFNSWPYTELCVILRGRVAVEGADGSSREYGPGESFLIPQGFAGIWHTLEPTEKIFVGVHAPTPGT